MTTHASETQLNELIDGTLAPDEKSRIASHVASCLPCAASVRRIEALVERARALPRDVTPPAGAWEATRAAARTSAPPGMLGHSRAHWPLMAAAAAVLVIATSAATVWVLGRDPAGPVPGETSVVAPAMLTTFAPVEARYVLAAAALQQTLDERQSVLDPATIATVERSLTTIDAAIAEARAALAQDPANGTLSRLLASSYEQKVTLLRRASELPPRS